MSSHSAKNSSSYSCQSLDLSQNNGSKLDENVSHEKILLLTSKLSDIIQVDGNVTVENSFNLSENRQGDPIKVHISESRTVPKTYRCIDRRNLIRIRRSQKLAEASNLPVLVTLNPRSLYNKLEQFHTLVEQTEASICFISET